MLVSDVIKGEKALPTYSTSVFNQYVNPSTTEPMDHYDPVTLENDIKKYKQKKRAQQNKFYSLAASLFLVCTLSITALTLTNEEQGIAKEKTASLVENITIDELKTSNNNISDKYLNKYYFGGTDNAVNSNINFIKLSKLYFSGHGIVKSNYKFIKNTRQKLEDSKKILTQENSIVTPTLDYDHTMIFLDQLASGEVKATDEERLEILRKLLVIAKDKNLHETDVICPSSGIYEHPVSKGDTLSGIMDKCFYRVNDSRIFDIKVILNIDEVVIMSIDENRVVTNIDISRDDGIYPMYSPR